MKSRSSFSSNSEVSSSALHLSSFLIDNNFFPVRYYVLVQERICKEWNNLGLS